MIWVINKLVETVDQLNANQELCGVKISLQVTKLTHNQLKCKADDYWKI